MKVDAHAQGKGRLPMGKQGQDLPHKGQGRPPGAGDQGQSEAKAMTFEEANRVLSEETRAHLERVREAMRATVTESTTDPATRTQGK